MTQETRDRTEPVFTWTETYDKNDPIVKFGEHIKKHGWWFSRPGEKPVNIMDIAPKSVNKEPAMSDNEIGLNANHESPILFAPMSDTTHIALHRPSNVGKSTQIGDLVDMLTNNDKVIEASQTREALIAQAKSVGMSDEQIDDILAGKPVIGVEGAVGAVDALQKSLQEEGPMDEFLVVGDDKPTEKHKPLSATGVKMLLATMEGIIASDPIASMMFNQNMEKLTKDVLKPMSDEEKERRQQAEMQRFQKNLEIRAHNVKIERAQGKIKVPSNAKAKRKQQDRQASAHLRSTPEAFGLRFTGKYENGSTAVWYQNMDGGGRSAPGAFPSPFTDPSVKIAGLYKQRYNGYPRDPVIFVTGGDNFSQPNEFHTQPAAMFVALYLGPDPHENINKILKE